MEETVIQAPPGRSVEALFARHEERLGRFLAQVVRDRALAEDLLQETFLVAVRSGRRLQDLDNVEAWLFAVARKRALHALRGARRLRAARERARSQPREEVRDPADAVAVRDLLERTLRPPDRILVVLRYVHGFDAVELAAITGRSHAAVRARLARIRRRLLEAAKGDADEEMRGGLRR